MAKTKSFSIPELKLKTFTVGIVGDSPLLTNRFSELDVETMRTRDKTSTSKKNKQARDQILEFRGSLYPVSAPTEKPRSMFDDGFFDGDFGLKAAAFKGALVRAAKGVGMAMTDARAAFQISAPAKPEDMVVLTGTLQMDERMAKISNGRAATLRYRGKFDPWYTIIEITVDADQITEEEVFNLLNRAGAFVGVGDYRPEKNGTFGRFHVATKDDVLDDELVIIEPDEEDYV